MAWRCSGASNNELVDKLATAKIIKSKNIKEVMKAVDRGEFVTNDPYGDHPVQIGYRVTISAPHMVCFLFVTYVMFNPS